MYQTGSPCRHCHYLSWEALVLLQSQSRDPLSLGPFGYVRPSCRHGSAVYYELVYVAAFPRMTGYFALERQGR